MWWRCFASPTNESRPHTGPYSHLVIPTVRDIAHLPIDQLPDKVRVEPITRPFNVTIRPPGSKSLTNRALLLAALAKGTSTLTGALVDADDTQVMIAALRQLGAIIDITPEFDGHRESAGNATLRVTGVDGRWKMKPGETITLNLKNAGTATRFLTAAAILQPPDAGGIVIDGSPRMQERPIGELVDALRQIGAVVEYLASDGCVPVKVSPPRGQFTNRITLGCAASSQFISAVLLIAPWLEQGLQINMTGPPTSWLFVLMSQHLLRRVGAKQKHSSDGSAISVRGGPLRAFEMAVESDATSAGYFAAVPAICRTGRVTLPGVGLWPDESLQGDSLFLEYIATSGAAVHADAHPISVEGLRSLPIASFDFGTMPDVAMTAAAIACFSDGRSGFFGLRTLRVKESDRIAALVTELGKIDVKAEPFTYEYGSGHTDEGITITPPPTGVDCSPAAPPVEFDTYDDHRMAMSLALIGLRRPNVIIRNPACVRKTYPTFWRDLAKLYGQQS